MSGGEISLQHLIEYLVKALVDEPDQVNITEVPQEDATTYEVRVAPGDLGKVIGKQGKTAAAMRTIIRAAGTKLNKRYHLDIVE